MHIDDNRNEFHADKENNAVLYLDGVNCKIHPRKKDDPSCLGIAFIAESGEVFGKCAECFEEEIIDKTKYNFRQLHAKIESLAKILGYDYNYDDQKFSNNTK